MARVVFNKNAQDATAAAALVIAKNLKERFTLMSSSHIP